MRTDMDPSQYRKDRRWFGKLGQKHRDLTITGFRVADATGKYKNVNGKQALLTVEVQCTCGNVFEVDENCIRNDLQTGCNACGFSRSAEAQRRYQDIVPDDKIRRAWSSRHQAMLTRCHDSDSLAYPDYGGRGITVCPEWRVRENYLRFIASLKGHTNLSLELDRENNDMGYSPDNCRLVTRAQNNENKRNSRRIVYRGKSLSITRFTHLHTYYRYTSSVSRHLRAGETPEQIASRSFDRVCNHPSGV